MPALITWWKLDVAELAPGAHSDAVAAIGTDLRAPAATRNTAATTRRSTSWRCSGRSRTSRTRARSTPARRRWPGVAAWFHDAVYDPAAPPGANEADSAELAVRDLQALGVRDDDVAAVRDLVLATERHARPGAPRARPPPSTTPTCGSSAPRGALRRVHRPGARGVCRRARRRLRARAGPRSCGRSSTARRSTRPGTPGATWEDAARAQPRARARVPPDGLQRPPTRGHQNAAPHTSRTRRGSPTAGRPRRRPRRPSAAGVTVEPGADTAACSHRRPASGRPSDGSNCSCPTRREGRRRRGQPGLLEHLPHDRRAHVLAGLPPPAGRSPLAAARAVDHGEPALAVLEDHHARRRPPPPQPARQPRRGRPPSRCGRGRPPRRARRPCGAAPAPAPLSAPAG